MQRYDTPGRCSVTTEALLWMSEERHPHSVELKVDVSVIRPAQRMACRFLPASSSYQTWDESYWIFITSRLRQDVLQKIYSIGKWKRWLCLLARNPLRCEANISTRMLETQSFNLKGKEYLVDVYLLFLHPRDGTAARNINVCVCVWNPSSRYTIHTGRRSDSSCSGLSERSYRAPLLQSDLSPKELLMYH